MLYLVGSFRAYHYFNFGPCPTVAIMNNKQSLIIDELAVGLYGHILISSAYWATLDRNLDEFFAIHNDNQHRTDLIKELRWVLLEHPLRKFPVSEIHLNDVSNWLIQCLERVAPHHPLEVETYPDPSEPKLYSKALAGILFQSLRRPL